MRRSIKKLLKKPAKKIPARLPVIPKLNLPDDGDMLKDFSQETQRHLLSGRNSLLVLESVPTDQEALDSIFKAFHTIKGLADFLKLEDIRDLTQAAENLLDLMRKEVLQVNRRGTGLIGQAIDRLQLLLKMLDEQIRNGGHCDGDYPSVDDLIQSLAQHTTRSVAPLKLKTKKQKILPVIRPGTTELVASEIDQALAASQKNIVLDRVVLNHWRVAFDQLTRDLKDCQGRLQERQRELIQEREVSLRLTQRAREEARLKSDYLAHMAHEIRTLLSAIMGFAELLKDANLNDKQREHLNTIVLSGNMTFEIVNHILDYAKVEAGKLKLEKVDFNLDRVIEDVFRVIRSRLQKKPIDLYFDVEGQVPRNLMGDPIRLKQIFINLIDNAIKFTEKGEIGLEVSFEGIETGGDKEKIAVLRFIVRDTGIGIPKDKIGQVFESFTQASESTTRLYGGTGLGLALCKNFVVAMGGDIKVESRLGEGSRFIFTLRFVLGLDETQKIAEPEFSGSTVLIVDSHEASSKTLQALCEKFKLSILSTARTAKQATELLLKLETERKPLPAIVFIDPLLSEKQGYHLAKKIRQQERYRKIQLVAVSSDVKISGKEEYSQAGFDLFLAKPFISGEVATVLTHLLGDHLPKTPVLSPKMQDKFSCKGARVLVVEDSLPNRELLKVHLEELGCICDYAKNGQKAIEQFQKSSYDICFMDLQMPVMGGLEAAKIIRQQLKISTPIIALTATEFQEEKDKCYEVGMNDYLTKPFGADQLKEKILKCIN